MFIGFSNIEKGREKTRYPEMKVSEKEDTRARKRKICVIFHKLELLNY